MALPGTLVFTGYKIVAGVMVVYGFIITGTVYYPPTPTPVPNTTGSTDAPTTVSTNVTDLNATTAEPEATKPTENKWATCGTAPPMRERYYKNNLAEFERAVLLGRILGGTPTEEGDWPWMVYLFKKPDGQRKGFFCGGTLISDQWVLTAAHCFARPNSPEYYGVVLGEHSASNLSVNEKTMDVKSIIRHERFSSQTLINDIALIKLAEPVTFTRYIRPACIVPKGFPTDAGSKVLFNGKNTTFAGRICTVLGWGATEAEPKNDIMHQVNLHIMPHFLCSHITRSSEKKYNLMTVNENHARFCAGGAVGEDTCDGDSGGPLLCIDDNDGNYYIHGITSYGTTPCGQRLLPGVYTRVADYHEWIIENSK